MKLLKLSIIFSMAVLLTFSCQRAPSEDTAEAADTSDKIERPSDAELHAYKAYHHARYMVVTAEQAGGTNKLINTRELPTEGTDPVVTPALDHLYSKAVIDLTSGPVYVEFPEEGEEFGSGEAFGVIESVKAAADSYMPVSGKIIGINDELLEDEPQALNEKPYEAWILKVELTNHSELEDLLSAEDYTKHCEEE